MCLKHYWHGGNIINHTDVSVGNLVSVRERILLPSQKITLWLEEIGVNLEFSKPLRQPCIGKRFTFASCIYLIIFMRNVSRNTLKPRSFRRAECDYEICVLFFVHLLMKNKNCFLNIKRYWCLLVVFIKITSNSLVVTTKEYCHLHCNVVLC